jgi:predicted phage baseplate assembly protein
MPFRPPALDDRSFDDLVAEALARIPAHTPEWTNPRQGDPGRTLIELFAWLTDTLLYRANLIPERQRLAFLRLLGIPMRPAIPATGLVAIQIDDDTVTSAISLRPLATIKGPAQFETRGEITVLPVSAEAYYKRPLNDDESASLTTIISGLKRVYDLPNAPQPYVTTPVFAGGAPEAGGFDLVARTIDQCLWLALLAPKKEQVEQVRAALGKSQVGGQQLINIGVMPAIETPALFEEIGPRARIPHQWEISTLNAQEEAEYLTLDVISDTSAGLTRRGVLRLALPAASFMRAPSNDVRKLLNAGVGDNPPRLDAPEKDDRLVCWLRLRPASGQRLTSLALSWVGVNVVEIDQRQTITGRVIGQSNGAADQEFQLPGQSVEPETLQVQIEEAGRGYQLWQRIDDLQLAGRDATVYTLDSEAGVIRLGDGMRGRIPETGRRIRVAQARVGGGGAGNLPPGSLAEISARDLRGDPVTTRLKVQQNLPTDGGEDAETLVEAEQRVPALFRHRDRAVTADDYRQLAASTPGVRMGRVEVMPRFKPQQRRDGVPGVVSVLTLPFKPGYAAPNPRPDRPFLESVHSYLDARRPLATELYVIGCEYVALGVSTAVTIRSGFDHDSVLLNVREALRRFLWPLAPGGVEGAGWDLGRAVRDRELEVVIAQTPGVSTISGVNLFRRQAEQWQRMSAPTAGAPVTLLLEAWQLPELLSVVAVEGPDAPADLRSAPGSLTGVAVPVVPEVC